MNTSSRCIGERVSEPYHGMSSIHEHAAADGVARPHQATQRQHEGSIGGHRVENRQFRVERVHASQRLLHLLDQRVLLLARRQWEVDLRVCMVAETARGEARGWTCMEHSAVSVRGAREAQRRAGALNRGGSGIGKKSG